MPGSVEEAAAAVPHRPAAVLVENGGWKVTMRGTRQCGGVRVVVAVRPLTTMTRPSIVVVLSRMEVRRPPVPDGRACRCLPF